MDIAVELVDLKLMHPQLLWDDIMAAFIAVTGDEAMESPISFQLTIQDVPGFGSGNLQLSIETEGILPAHVLKLKRTFEPSRLVELAAIAVAGIGIYHAGGHEIRNLAFRGSSADYLVDQEQLLLEIAGRSRRSDFNSAWHQRWDRL